MHISFTKEEREFQQEARRFFAEKCPEDITRKQDSGAVLYKEDYVRCQKIM